MKRQAGGVVMTGTLEAARLDLQHVIMAVIVLIDPLADRIAHKRGLDLFGPVATVRVDAAGGLVPNEQQVRGFRRADEIDGLENGCNERHPETEAVGAAPNQKDAPRLR